MQPQPASWPVRRIAWWALIAITAVLWQGRGLLRDLSPPADALVDFYQEWASARNFLSGEPIYEPQRESSVRYLGAAPATHTHFFLEVNAHPPTAVLLGLPLAGLDYPTAVLVWNFMSLAALGAGIWIIARQLGFPASRWMVLPAIALLLLCWPLRSHLQQGQLAMVLLLLIAGAWAADRSGQEGLAGILLGIAAAVKLFPALLFLHFLCRRQWRVVGAGLACLAVLTAATLMLLGPAAYASYLSDVPPAVAEWRSAWNNASLPGLWSKLFEPGTKGNGVVAWVHNPPLACGLIVVSCAAVIVLLARLAHRAWTRAECDRAFGAAVAGALLVTPVTWEHGFLLLLLPLAVFWAAAPLGSRQRRLLVLLAVILMVINPASFYQLWRIGNFQAGTRVFCSTPQVLVVLSVQCYALLAFFGMAVRQGMATQPATVAGPVILRMELRQRQAAA